MMYIYAETKPINQAHFQNCPTFDLMILFPLLKISKFSDESVKYEKSVNCMFVYPWDYV